MVQEEMMIRKGPWTEHEDAQLNLYVNSFGDRRWDFIAKVSGLKRTGKSCRLRWVNYLHPGLKRGKMTAYEERLVLELHTKWGNRWSKIARKLPGRTDNEIKNYWRTHLRKMAHEKKRPTINKDLSPSSSFSNSSSSIVDDLMPVTGNKERSFYDTGGHNKLAAKEKKVKIQGDSTYDQEMYSMEEIWNDIVLPEDDTIKPLCGGYSEEVCNFYSPNLASPVWDYCPDSLWMMDDQEESKMFGQETTFLTG